MKARIEDYADGFGIVVINDDGIEDHFYFSQEDAKDEILDMLYALGIETYYDEANDGAANIQIGVGSVR